MLRVLSYQWQFCKFPANMSPTTMSRRIIAGFCEQQIFFLITFPTTRPYSSSSLSLFPSQTHNTSTTQSKSILVIHPKIFCSSSTDQHKAQLRRSSIHRFHFQVRPKRSPSICLHARSRQVLLFLFLFFIFCFVFTLYVGCKCLFTLEYPSCLLYVYASFFCLVPLLEPWYYEQCLSIYNHVLWELWRMEREADEILWEGHEDERGITRGQFVAVVVLLQCNQYYVEPNE